MDGWQLWKRVWHGVSRKKQGRQYAVAASRTRSAPVSGTGTFAPAGRYLLGGTRHYSFISQHVAAGNSQRPKMLLDVDCSNLLTGGSGDYENFSSTCWLEDHLHHFGEPVSPRASSASMYCHLRQDGEEEEEEEEEEEDVLDPEERQEASTISAELEDVMGQLTVRDGEQEGEDEGDGEGDGEDDAVSHDSAESRTVPVAGRRLRMFGRSPRHAPLRRTRAYNVSQPPPYITDPPPSYEEATAGSCIVVDIGNADYMW